MHTFWFRHVNVILKVLLLVLLLHAALYPELPQYQMKGMEWRMIAYPTAVFGTLGLALLLRRGFGWKFRYPHDIDALITCVATLDMAGNTLNFYNTIEAWDDIMHLVNSVPWALVAGLALVRINHLRPWIIAGLTVGYGAMSHVLWEIAEYITFLPKNDMELPTAYRDTIGDLSLSIIGTLIAGLVIGMYARTLRRQRVSATNARN